MDTARGVRTRSSKQYPMTLRSSRSATPSEGRLEQEDRKYEREVRLHGSIVKIHKLFAKDEQIQYQIEVAKHTQKKQFRGRQPLKTRKTWFSYEKAVSIFGMDELNEHLNSYYERQDDEKQPRERVVTKPQTKRK
ncbi:hypothetical protein FGO68_gene105 [Halteria grandinella]|uniref:Uncharacterized protein n=1 Tax=Halteria grandinella TaxID=5974 RepID=A0A8J8T193_HALGN|nr:hypothetical protein FGO68_gene105 [Halteria grandinella]